MGVHVVNRVELFTFSFGFPAGKSKALHLVVRSPPSASLGGFSFLQVGLLVGCPILRHLSFAGDQFGQPRFYMFFAFSAVCLMAGRAL